MGNLNQNKLINYIIQAVLYFCLFFWYTYAGDFRPDIEIYIFLSAVSFCIYFYWIYRPPETHLTFFVLIGFAFFVRLYSFYSLPVLSDDFFRYFWDGKVFLSGTNPYKYAPAAQQLFLLRDDLIYPFINFPFIPTVYPPVAQILFLLTAVFKAQLVAWKILMLVFEIAGWYALYKILMHLKIDKYNLLVFILNPLLIIESYYSVHLDLIAVSVFTWAIYLLIRNRIFSGAIAMAISFLVKFTAFFPAIGLIPLNRRKIIPVFLLTVTVFFLPFVLNGILPAAGFVSFANRWEFNGLIYNIFCRVLEFSGFKPSVLLTLHYLNRSETVYLNSALIYKIIAVSVFIFWVVKRQTVQDKSPQKLIKDSFLFITLILFLSPTLYPWYLIWLLPLLAIHKNIALLGFTFFIQFSYYILKPYSMHGTWHESDMIFLVQYVPVLILLIYDQKYLRQRNLVKQLFHSNPKSPGPSN